MATVVAVAATLDSIEVTHEDDVYSLFAETRLNASPDAIHAVLIDYERFSRISSVYKEHGYLEPAADGTPIVYTRMEGCLTRLFCKSMTRVERLEINTPEHIRTVTIPEQSDFKQSISEWFIEPEGPGARVTYMLIMEPDFWVPPLIGPAYLQHKLRRGGGTAIERIERLAQELEQEQLTRASEQGVEQGLARSLEQGVEQDRLVRTSTTTSHESSRRVSSR